MLAGPRLGDNAGLAHAPGEQDLAKTVVDLVAAGVIELVALEVDLGAAELGRHALGEVERRGAAGVVRIEVCQLGLEGRIGLGGCICLLKLEYEGHERFSHETSAEHAEETLVIGTGAVAVGRGHCRHGSRLDSLAWRACALSLQVRPVMAQRAAVRAASMKARMRPGSLMPGLHSTPEETSILVAPVVARANATFSGVRPPESM